MSRPLKAVRARRKVYRFRLGRVLFVLAAASEASLSSFATGVTAGVGAETFWSR